MALFARRADGGGFYLPALALEHDGRLVTFDSGIALSAVKGAAAGHRVTPV